MARPRLPPGQRLVDGFPVLDLGVTPNTTTPASGPLTVPPAASAARFAAEDSGK